MRIGAAVSLVCIVFACSEKVEVGFDRPAQGGMSGAGVAGAAGGAGRGGAAGQGGGGATTAGTAGEGSCEPSACLERFFYECGDCDDNDGDGLIDSADPDCLGPCDNTENSYFSGIPGANNASCRQDCYFDRDSGSGNDGCEWSHACDPRSQPPDYPPSGDPMCSEDPTTSVAGRSCEDASASQPQECLDYCLPITPNGCDCFGCCELPAGSNQFVWIGSSTDGRGTCDAARVNDREACRRCTPVLSCFNRCERCEVCVGTAEMDPSCDAGAPVCALGAQPCGPTTACPPSEYCITGCCIALPR